MRIFSALVISLISTIVTGGTTIGLKSYKCTQEKSTGFVFIGGQWKSTSFSTVDYILRPLGTDNYEYALFETENDEFGTVCRWREQFKRKILECTIDKLGNKAKGKLFMFDSSSLKFIHSSINSYMDHDNKTPNSVYIEMGTCKEIATKKQ
ncbi:MAG: hypothetical protein OQJ89_08995 [Kangiellaceae bacterium]|nr:hypothetical protein [Kangiellaceae bacterium]MCW9017087.1 hypothetical protein [Kangiellaceae bacterium]